MQNDPEPYETGVTYVGQATRIEVPLFTLEDVLPCHCARYTRLAAKHIFGIEYPAIDAWELRDCIAVITEVSHNNDLIQLIKDNIIIPGMLFGVYYPESDFNQEDRPYTHMSLFLGIQHNKPAMLEQFHQEIRISTTEDYDMDNLAVKEVLGYRP